MQKSKSSVYVQGFYCTLYFGLLVHIKRGALGPVGSLKSKFFIKQKSLAMKFRKRRFLFIKAKFSTPEALKRLEIE